MRKFDKLCLICADKAKKKLHDEDFECYFCSPECQRLFKKSPEEIQDLIVELRRARPA